MIPNLLKDSKVVVRIFKSNRIATIIETIVLKKETVYNVKCEDGKIYESVPIDGENSIHIDSKLTKAFFKIKDDDNRTERMEENQEKSID